MKRGGDLTREKGGRLSKYESEWKEKLIIIEGWARDDLTDEQIANNTGISTGTLYEWKKKYLEFWEALKRGKEIIDREVENALLKRALGCKCREVTYERIENMIVDSNGNVDMEPGTKIKTVIKEVVPDTTAQRRSWSF